jgi:hypothetical protein
MKVICPEIVLLKDLETEEEEGAEEEKEEAEEDL